MMKWFLLMFLLIPCPLYAQTGSPARMIPRANVTVASVVSEENLNFPGYRKENAIDGNPGTFWHTEFSPANIPTSCATGPNYCWAIFRFSQDYTTNKLIYWPALSSLAGGAQQINGRVGNYHIYVSTSPTCDINSTWTEVATGTWLDDTNTKRALWNPTVARCMKVESRANANGTTVHMHIGEIAFFEAAAPVADVPSPGALSDFTTRCTAPGVTTCYGFDADPVGSPPNHMKDASGADVGVNLTNDGAGTLRITRDTTYKVSGAGSLVFTAPPPPHSGPNIAGNFELNPFANRSIAGIGDRFGPNEDFYIQFWRRQTNETQFNTWIDSVGNGAGMKYFVLYPYPIGCGPLELTLHTYYLSDIAAGYSNCGQVSWFTQSDLATYTAATPQWIQQGSTDCQYGTYKNCFFDEPDVWTNYYCKFHVGTLPFAPAPRVPDSTVECWYARQGASVYTKFINVTSNYHLFASSAAGTGLDSLELMMYMTDLLSTSGDAGVTSKIYFDELIISTQPIAFPGTTAPPLRMQVGGTSGLGGRVSIQ